MVLLLQIDFELIKTEETSGKFVTIRKMKLEKLDIVLMLSEFSTKLSQVCV